MRVKCLLIMRSLTHTVLFKVFCGSEGSFVKLNYITLMMSSGLSQLGLGGENLTESMPSTPFTLAKKPLTSGFCL